jgi:hypothetical protein
MSSSNLQSTSRLGSRPGTTLRLRARRWAIVALGVTAVMLVAVTGSAASPQNHLTPILNCIDVNGDGSITAHFGYSNSWTNQVTVPAGKTSGGGQNWFLPAPADRGQPSQFQPGTFSDVFTVTFTPTGANPTLEWRLSDVNSGYGSVIADAGSSRCTPVPAFGFDSPWPVILVVVGLGAMVALRRRPAVSGT